MGIVWGPWMTTGIPEVGDYVQVDYVTMCCGIEQLIEGVVVEVHVDPFYGPFVRTTDPKEEEIYGHATHARKWRKAALPEEQKEKEREEELV